ncbi:MAG: hypothetical protein U9N48_08970 [Euryarchaeota archaeon]|nr:hypothetical protein [Euryarchaeota archaeon]
MTRKLIVILIIFICLLGYVEGKEGPGGPGGSTGSSDTGSSSSKRIVKLDLESMIKNAESWKKNDPEEFEYLKTLLSKPFVTTDEYKWPSALIYYPSSGTTVNRNDELDIRSYVWNSNPIEIRRVLYLTLEMREEGSEEFSPITDVQKIQTNEYDKKYNLTERKWPEIEYVRDLGATGNATLQIRVQDGQNDYNSTYMSRDLPDEDLFREISLTIINNPPQITDMSANKGPVHWKDPLEYAVLVEDADGDLVAVTLHILDEDGNEFSEPINRTQRVIPGANGTRVTFTNAEYNFFDKGDAGKNFTYSYSYGDGMDRRETKIMQGPHFRPNPEIRVEKPGMEPVGGANYYWWQGYDFSLQVQNPKMDNLTVSLYTDTPGHPDTRYPGDGVVIGRSDEFVKVKFQDVHPFDVLDCGEQFSYRFKYSAPDQDGKYFTENIPGERISPKIVRYSIYSSVMVTNILLVLIIALLGGIVMERWFYR